MPQDFASHLQQGVTRLESVGIEYRFSRMWAGLTPDDVQQALPDAAHAAAAFRRIVETGDTPGMTEKVLWPRLTPHDRVEALKAWAEGVRDANVVVSVGIGGSYLGNRVLRDALLGTRWNAMPRKARGDRPKLVFAGYHLDPAELRDLVAWLKTVGKRKKPAKVAILAISKSGGTTETLATTLALLQACRAESHLEPSLTALTAPGSVLADLADELGGDLLPFPNGIGGRFSVLSDVGLATAAASGVDVEALLEGAAAARDELLAADDDDLARNPALLYALLHHLHGQRGKPQAVFMPYSDRLKGVSEWYVQLLAESLGKAEDRQGNEVHCGRTPIVAVGTTDMHAQTQLHQAGPRDKTVTTLDVADWGQATVDRVPELKAAGKLAGKTIAELNTLAREANEQALAGDGRPSDALVLDRLDARTLGGLLVMLMSSVCYEGELLDVCTYDQPGVEAYKVIMKAGL